MLLVFLWNLDFGRTEGILLFAGLIGYNFFLILQRKEPELKLRLRKSKLVTDTLIFLIGTGLVVLGGYILRLGAVGIARAVGITEWVIGATVIAAGTSAPEFATSLMASLKGHHGISSGNLVGSCIYNVLGVLGLAGILRPMEVSPNARSSIPMLILLVILAIVFLGTHKRLSRIEGIILIAVSLLIWIFEFL
jgi:cation:H+ antiporter